MHPSYSIHPHISSIPPTLCSFISLLGNSSTRPSLSPLLPFLHKHQFILSLYILPSIHIYTTYKSIFYIASHTHPPYSSTLTIIFPNTTYLVTTSRFILFVPNLSLSSTCQPVACTLHICPASDAKLLTALSWSRLWRNYAATWPATSSSAFLTPKTVGMCSGRHGRSELW